MIYFAPLICFALLAASSLLEHRAQAGLNARQRILARGTVRRAVWTIFLVAIVSGAGGLFTFFEQQGRPWLLPVGAAAVLVLAVMWLVADFRRLQRFGLPAAAIRKMRISRVLAFLALAAFLTHQAARIWRNHQEDRGVTAVTASNSTDARFGHVS